LADPILSGECQLRYITSSVAMSYVTYRLLSQASGWATFSLQFGVRALCQEHFGSALSVTTIPHVVAISANVKMLNSDARRVIAMMQYGQSVGDRTIGQQPRQSVDSNASQWPARAFTYKKSAVAIVVNRSLPDVTGVRDKSSCSESVCQRRPAVHARWH